MKPLVIVGDSWGCGEWQHNGNKELFVSHPGMTDYLGDSFRVINLSRGGASNWQTCYTLHNWLEYNMTMLPETPHILILQSDAARADQADRFDIDYRQELEKSTSIQDFYVRMVEMFYIKLHSLAGRYDLKFCVSGGLTDLDLQTLGLYPSLVPICESWIKLLDPAWKTSLVPLRIHPQLFQAAKDLARFDLCDEIMDQSNQNLLILQPLLETKSEYFGPSIGDYHPSRQAHQIFSDHVKHQLGHHHA